MALTIRTGGMPIHMPTGVLLIYALAAAALAVAAFFLFVAAATHWDLHRAALIAVDLSRRGGHL